jgi:hypothetical protein
VSNQQPANKVAHTWFLNETGAAGGAGITPPSPGYTGIPTISILSVDEDESVTIKTHNFPANQDFKVLMGKMGTRGIGGIHVTTIASGSGGSFTETFEIPNELKGNYRIAIRLQTSDGFSLPTTGSTTTPQLYNPYLGIPESRPSPSPPWSRMIQLPSNPTTSQRTMISKC